MLPLCRPLMRRTMLAVFTVNKSGSVKQCLISSDCAEPIFPATDKQSDRDIFDSRRDEQQIVCIISGSPLNSLSVMEWNRPSLDARQPCEVKYILNYVLTLLVLKPVHHKKKVPLKFRWVRITLKPNGLSVHPWRVRSVLNANRAGPATSNVFFYH